MKFFASLILCAILAASAFAHPTPQDSQTINIKRIGNGVNAHYVFYGESHLLNRANHTILELVWDSHAFENQENFESFNKVSKKYMEWIGDGNTGRVAVRDYFTDEVKEKFIKIMAIKGINVAEINEDSEL